MRSKGNENGNVTERIKTVLEEMENFVTPQMVVGKPIKSDDVTIIPLVDVSFGLGFGFNGKVSEEVQGGGIGGNVSPNSLLIIQNGEVKLLSIKESGSIAQMIPQILDKLDLNFIKKSDSQTKVKFEDDGAEE